MKTNQSLHQTPDGAGELQRQAASHMATSIQSVATFPKEKAAAVRRRHFCQQWRHSYLLLAVVFSVVVAVSALAIPRLENTRINGGLHPVDALFLMDVLRLSWVLPVVTVVLYASSFLFPALNTPKAVAVTALSSVILLAIVLLGALIHIGLWS